MVIDFSIKIKKNLIQNFSLLRVFPCLFLIFLCGPTVPSSAYAAYALFLPLPTPRGSLPSPLQAILGPHFSVISLKLASVGKRSHLGQKFGYREQKT